MTEFSQLGLSEALLSNLEAGGFKHPTPIQAKAIPLALEGRDVLGLAQTGTGKTLAFGLPLINLLKTSGAKRRAKGALALVLAPTRELVNQIADNLRAPAEAMRLKVSTVVGGQSVNRQARMMEKGTDILVATPGRLIDLMERGDVDLSTVKFFVLDEADQMLDMGFIHALRRIAPALGTPRQTMLFSATMPSQMEELSRAYLKDPAKVQVTPPGKAADKVTQSVHFVDKADKPTKLREILDADRGALTLVFARTKHGAEKLKRNLERDGYDAASIHGNKSQNQRDRAITEFRAGTVTILVATDVAARGIDIPGVSYVINYDLPEVPESYVHRIGRTARAGREGEAVAFCSDEEAGLLRQIQKLMKIDIPVASGTAPQGAAANDGGRSNGGRGRGRGGNGGGRGGNGGGNGGGGNSGRSRRRPRSRNANAA